MRLARRLVPWAWWVLRRQGQIKDSHGEVLFDLGAYGRLSYGTGFYGDARRS